MERPSSKAHGDFTLQLYKGEDLFSFEYSQSFLENFHEGYTLDPDLSLYNGRQYPSKSKKLFGIFSDSSPDRWGRRLMQRREALEASGEGRKPRRLSELDYLFGVFDEARMGALRFSLKEDGNYLSSNKSYATPPGFSSGLWKLPL